MDKTGKPNFLQNKAILRTIFRANPEERAELLNSVGTSVIQTFVSIAYNSRKGRLDLTPYELSKLAVYRTHINLLLSPKFPLKLKRQLLIDNPELVTRLLKPLVDLF